MKKKVFWFDVETTGLDAQKQDVIQLAYMIEIDGEVKESGNVFMQPFSYENISQEALNVHGTTIEQLKSYQEPSSAYIELHKVLGRYVNKYDKTDKFQPAGYNVRFDLDFLKQFFIKNDDEYFGSFFNYKGIDPLPVLYFFDGTGRINPLKNYKLETVCEYFEIGIDAHDALSDIRATKMLVERLSEQIHTVFEGGK